MKKSLFNAIFLFIHVTFWTGLLWNFISPSIVAKSVMYTGGIVALIWAFYLFAIKKVSFPKSPKKYMIIAVVGAVLVLAGAGLKLYGIKEWGNIMLFAGVIAKCTLIIHASLKNYAELNA